MDVIQVHNANEHNLRHVDVTIPRGKLVVFTGVSGSGKSSLAFDTIFAEGQRRYVDSLSTYARQYMDQLEKPNVDAIDGLSPAISIDQKTASRNPRSTVGTVTELLDYLRLLYARVGQPHCPDCGVPIESQSIQRITDTLMGFPIGTRLQLMAPVVRGRKGEYNALFQQLIKEGYHRVQIDGETHLLEELPPDYRLEKTKRHNVSVVLDRIVINDDHDKDKEARTGLLARLTQAIETSFKKAEGFMALTYWLPEGSGANAGKEFNQLFSLKLACPECDQGFEELAPRLFSFNSPYGACPTCEGLGVAYEVSEPLLVPDGSLSLQEGAIAPFHKLLGKYYRGFIKGLAKQYGLAIDKPYDSLPANHKHLLLYGTEDENARRPRSSLMSKATADDDAYDDDAEAMWADMAEQFEGIVPILERRMQVGSPAQKEYIQPFLVEIDCPACHGKRLKPLSLAVTLGGLSLYDLGELSLSKALYHIQSLSGSLSNTQLMIAREPLKEIASRLGFLIDVGLDYLTFNRRTATLSGGEAQRIRLASQIGSKLSGVLYVLDEPSIGLHPHNTAQLIETLKHLRDLGNSLIVVEHDEDTIRQSDWIVDIGPLAGQHGGHVMVSGPIAELEASTTSLTADYLYKRKELTLPAQRREPSGEAITIKGATRHNLKNINVSFPLGQFICVTGLSGSGKSTLVFDLLYPLLQYHFGKHRTKPTGYKEAKGVEHIDKFIHIDQSPIGRSPRSNPATYTGLFDTIRNLFSQCDEAKIRGFTPSHFSFNVKAGQCPQCKGDGYHRIQMQFLPDVFTPCTSCHGKRYKPNVLDVLYYGRSIADVLAMTVEDALGFIGPHSKTAQTMLQVLADVGLGYIQLGQSSTTLSGGEAQRLKLATEFCKRSTGKTLYLMDEPTIGLHWQDLEHLLTLIQRLVDAGNTVVVIEHNLDLIKMADHIIDMGPMGGLHGGELVVQGTPEIVAAHSDSLTGRYLAPYLKQGADAPHLNSVSTNRPTKSRKR